MRQVILIESLEELIKVHELSHFLLTGKKGPLDELSLDYTTKMWENAGDNPIGILTSGNIFDVPNPIVLTKHLPYNS